MPFFFNNENIEVIIEDNPDDIFNPSGTDYVPRTTNITIRQLISQEIKNMFETHTKTPVDGGLFSKADSIKDDNFSSYLFRFETPNDEYEIIYHIPSILWLFLEQLSQNITNEAIFLNLSNAIIDCLNEEDFSFLEDIKLTGLSRQTVENKKIKNLKNLYTFDISIDKKEYVLYLQLDNQFNKLF